MAASEAVELPFCLRAVAELTPEEEQALLEEIFTTCWDQGCLILDSAELRAPGFDPHLVDALLRSVADRSSLHPARDLADPLEPNPLPMAVLAGQESGLLVISQRCDIVKPLCIEPLVEVALARRSTDPGLVAAARSGNSACYLHLADEEGELDAAWLADLRTRGQLPKLWLRGRTPVQLLAPGRPRRRFANWLGERSSRIPVPTEIVDGFQSKVRDWLYASATRREQCAHFSDLFLLAAEDGGWAVIAILGDGKSADKAIVDFDALLGAIVERVDPFPISSDYSGVLRPEELSQADSQIGYRLDLKRVTYGSKSSGAAQAEPTLGER